MIGNDLVDLRDPETDAVHPRFDGRVFSPAERRLLDADGDRGRLRWVLWAAKEAAYKLVRQLDPAAVFSPPRFAVDLSTSPRWGEDQRPFVIWEGRRLRLEVEIGPDWVHAVVSLPGLSRRAIVRGVAETGPAAPGLAVRRLALDTLAPLVGISPEDLTVIREGRLPRLRAGDGILPVGLSLSHHGRFVAFAAAIPFSGLEEEGVAA